jgi:type VI secretion system protein VasD
MTAIRRHLALGVFISLLQGILVGCASSPPPPPPPPPPLPEPPKPTLVQTKVESSADLNPDINGRPSPIVLRIYELRSLSAFNEADFFALHESDTELLGQDLKAKEVMELMPGEQHAFTRELQPDTRYLAVVAAYRDLEQARWRAALEIPAHQTTPLVIWLERLAVSIKKSQ